MERNWLVPFAALATCEWLAAQLIAWCIGYPARPDYLFHFGVTAIVGALLLAGFFFIQFARLARTLTPNPTRELVKHARENAERLAAVGMGLAFATIHSLAFNWSKSMLPFVVPFWADKSLADFDQMLFGLEAWKWAYNMVGRASEIFRWAYVAWLPLVIVLPTAVICMPASARKAELLTTYMLVWIVGGALSYAFSSAGPLFYGPLGLGNRFADLTAQPYLKTIPKVAGYLWDNYRASQADPGGGISAFPSLHVAIACWMATVVRHWLAWVFPALIFFGSFLLGWHYFLDAPAGIALAITAHVLSRWYHRVRRRGPRTASEPPEPVAIA